MECIKLNQTHNDMFYDFINTQIEQHNLNEDPQWQSVKFIDESIGRNIYGVVDNNQLQVITASNDLPNMPWTTSDSLIARRDQGHFTNFKNISRVAKLQLEDCESRGKWGSFWIRKHDLDNAIKDDDSDRKIQGQGVSKLGERLGKLYDEKYNITDAAYIKAGNLTGNKLYDYALGNTALPYDVTIRFVSMKIQYMNTLMRDKITYGS